jgi:hypothetical protein
MSAFCLRTLRASQVSDLLPNFYKNQALKKKDLNVTLWSWALLKRPPVVKPLDGFPAFYATRRFITAFTRALHLSLSWSRPIQSIPPHPIFPRFILILSTHPCLTVFKRALHQSLSWARPIQSIPSQPISPRSVSYPYSVPFTQNNPSESEVYWDVS